METALTLFILVLFSLLVVLLVWFLVEMAMLPGKIAQKRNHPQAEAILVAGWLGLLMTMGVLWAFAVVWAYTKPVKCDNVFGQRCRCLTGGARLTLLTRPLQQLFAESRALHHLWRLAILSE